MVDGEIVALDSDGLLAFNRLQDFDADNDSMGTQASNAAARVLAGRTLHFLKGAAGHGT